MMLRLMAIQYCGLALLSAATANATADDLVEESWKSEDASAGTGSGGGAVRFQNGSPGGTPGQEFGGRAFPGNSAANGEFKQFVQSRGGGGGTGGRGPGPFGPGSFARSGVVHIALPSMPIVVVTKPMPTQIEKEWSEDLRVMDKLLRDAVTRVSGDASPAQAMGIRMTMMGGKVEPMYVEDCGAVFGFSVSATLAPAAKGEPAAIESPGDGESAWERAKRNLKSDGAGAGPLGALPPGLGGAAGPQVQPRKFRQAVVEKLVDATLKVLPEATNLRHLSAQEVVFVTFSGVDDAGATVRLSLKAKKSDIDQAAAGKLSAQEFRMRIARSRRAAEAGAK